MLRSHTGRGCVLWGWRSSGAQKPPRRDIRKDPLDLSWYLGLEEWVLCQQSKGNTENEPRWDITWVMCPSFNE